MSATKVGAILAEIETRMIEAFGLAEDRAYHDPRPSELPDAGTPYVAIRHRLSSGRRDTGGYDSMVIEIDVAAEVPDPGGRRSDDRQALVDAARARLTPWSGGIYAAIPGLEEPFVTESLTASIDDMPGMLFVGLTLQGTVTLPRGGYDG